MAVPELTTYLVLLLPDNPDHEPGLWATQSADLGSMLHKCALRYTPVHIYEFAEQPSYVKPEYVQWGGFKLHHVARVQPSHDWARAMSLLESALMDTSKEQVQQLTQRSVEQIVEACQRRLTMNLEPQPDVEEIEVEDEN